MDVGEGLVLCRDVSYHYCCYQDNDIKVKIDTGFSGVHFIILEEVKAIEISDFSFVYPDGTQALDGINLELPLGESLGIVGANGAGKSTLLLSLTGFIQGCGSIKVLGIPVIPRNFKRIRAQLGYVFQDPDDQLFCPRVFDDVAFGPMNQGLSIDAVRERVTRALESVGMQGYENRLSHHLSHGEKKRIALAAVLATEPAMLALDEPFSGLDLRGKRGLYRVLKDLSLSKVIVSHDLGLIAGLCDRVAVFERGRVVAYERTQDIISDRGLLESCGVEAPYSMQGYDVDPLGVAGGRGVAHI